MPRPTYTPDQQKAVTVGKLDQRCSDCGRGSAISTDKCIWCGCKDIEYVTHQQQGIDDPTITSYLCGSSRPDPARMKANMALRWPKRQTI